MELKIGPYREVYEAHRKNFLSNNYLPLDAAALAQAIVARALPEVALSYKAAFFESILPGATQLLEWDNYEGVALKVQSALQANADLFTDSDDPDDVSILTNGVYPGFAVVKVFETGEFYAVDWSMSDGGKISLSNARCVSTYWPTMAQGVTEGLLPGLDLMQHAALLPLEVERDYLSALLCLNKVQVAEVKLDGPRPVEEMEFVKYLRSSKLIAEAMAEKLVLPGGPVLSEMTPGDAAVRLAEVARRIRETERQCFEARLALARPLGGASMFEKGTTIQTVIIDKAKFSKSEAEAMAARNSWGSKSEDTGTSYRLRQHDPDACEAGSYRTIKLKEGVSVVLCKLKAGSKNEQWLRLTEAGDFVSMAGHTVHMNHDDVKDGDLSGVESQIKAHNRFGDKLDKAGFKSSPWSPSTYSKAHDNGYETTVKVHAGKAHVGVTRHGEVHHMVGTASSGPELDGHIDAASAKAKKMPAIAGYEEEKTVAAGGR